MSNTTRYVFLLLAISLCCQTKETLYIGGLFGLDTSRGGWNSAGIIPAVQMAIDEINYSSDILKDYQLKLLIKDSQVSKTNVFLEHFKATYKRKYSHILVTVLCSLEHYYY